MAKYSDTYRVRIGDSDTRGLLKIPSLLSMLQELAKDHAEVLGVGASNLLPMDLGWALSKMHLDIERLPSCGERITIKTWPSTRNKIFTEREFEVVDELGDHVASARSLWILFDLKKRKIERLERLGQWQRADEFADDFKFADMPLAPSNEEKFSCNFGVRKDDLDMNFHVNNAVYLTWALEPVPLDFYENHKASKVEIWYLSEVLNAQRLDSICDVSETLTRHSIISEGRERARAKIEWINA